MKDASLLYKPRPNPVKFITTCCLGLNAVLDRTIFSALAGLPAPCAARRHGHVGGLRLASLAELAHAAAEVVDLELIGASPGSVSVLGAKLYRAVTSVRGYGESATVRLRRVDFLDELYAKYEYGASGGGRQWRKS